MALPTIRTAATQDAGLIWSLLRDLAAYENLLPAFTLTEGDVVRDFFDPDAPARCELAFVDGEAVGLVTWFWTYRSFAAARGIFLEDLFVVPQCRGKAYGTALFRHMAAKALALGAQRLEWLVLDWNAPAQKFYKGIGAAQVESWLPWRLEQDAMQKLAGS